MTDKERGESCQHQDPDIDKRVQGCSRKDYQMNYELLNLLVPIVEYSLNIITNEASMDVTNSSLFKHKQAG